MITLKQLENNLKLSEFVNSIPRENIISINSGINGSWFVHYEHINDKSILVEIVNPPDMNEVLEEMVINGQATPVQMRRLIESIRPILEENAKLKNMKEKKDIENWVPPGGIIINEIKNYKNLKKRKKK